MGGLPSLPYPHRILRAGHNHPGRGLTEEQANEATGLYVAGRSLAWLDARYRVSHTTVATALRRQGIPFRPRPGWT